MTGFWIRKDARIFNCGYFNNWRFKMDNPTVFRHDKGRLVVTGGRFSKNSPNATLYAAGKDAGTLVWRDNYTLRFSASEMAGLSAVVRPEVPGDVPVVLHDRAADVVPISLAQGAGKGLTRFAATASTSTRSAVPASALKVTSSAARRRSRPDTRRRRESSRVS